MFAKDAIVDALENRWLRHPTGASYLYLYTDRTIPPSLRQAVYDTHPKSGSNPQRLIVYQTCGTLDRGAFSYCLRSDVAAFSEYEFVEHEGLLAELHAKLETSRLWYETDKHVYLAEHLPALWSNRRRILADPRACWARLDIMGFGSAFGGAVQVPFGLLLELWDEGRLRLEHQECGDLAGCYRGASGLSVGQKWAACTHCGAAITVGSSGTSVRLALKLCRERLVEAREATQPPSHPYRFDRLVDLYAQSPAASDDGGAL